MAEINIREFRKKLRKFEQFLGNQFQDCCCGITVPQCHCLLAVEELEPTTVVHLAEYLHLDKSTLSRTVESLVNEGYLLRKTNPQDRRWVKITLSEKGRQQAETMHRVNDTYFSNVLKQVPEGDRDNVVRYLGLFVEAIRAFEDKTEAEKSCCQPE